jgi:hypothetical protein
VRGEKAQGEAVGIGVVSFQELLKLAQNFFPLGKAVSVDRHGADDLQIEMMGRIMFRGASGRLAGHPEQVLKIPGDFGEDGLMMEVGRDFRESGDQLLNGDREFFDKHFDLPLGIG